MKEQKGPSYVDSRALIVSRTSPDAFRAFCVRLPNAPKSADVINMVNTSANPHFALMVGLLSLTACAAPPPTEVGTVAQSGIKFAESVPPLLNNALSEAIASNSDTLISAHANASSEARRTALLASDSAYRERAEIFADVGSHAQLLKAYFVTLMAFADTRDDSAVGKEAETLVNEMGALDHSIAKFEIGGRSVASITGALTPPVVAEFQSVAVEQELREHGDDVAKAIELQRSFLRAAGDDLQLELATERREQAFKDVIEPYLSGNQLPSDWKALRAKALADGRTQSVAALNAAAVTAENLKISFIAMAEGNRSTGLFTQLENGVNNLGALVTAIRGAAPPRRDATTAAKPDSPGAN
jgi:hypothetical protein